ncbi:MAG: NADH-ubiquinone oxidoreductase chain C [uncultured Thermoleophilia bacterium]|uniref:NADH-quinone oxidoreductase subunit C n=1 Tax=uncultured Thermoleophilia bacterium TaxID=1497501 RepID=A0A6J4U356_9ACTN|nr:MAG: NADH-ubiquinone oxidoreductase chain C [uncultured Thermoleophilia bacterium]
MSATSGARGDALQGQDGGVLDTADARHGETAIAAVQTPSWGLPDHEAAERLGAALGGQGLVGTRVHRGELTVVVETARFRDAALLLRDTEGYDFCSDVVGADYLGYEGDVAGYWGGSTLGRDMNSPGLYGQTVVPERPGQGRFAVSAHLLKLRTVGEGEHRRLRLQTWVEDGQAVPSLVSVYPSVDFHERETFDMFGIPFEGHPNLRRILMPEDWGGHPLRKDYPVGGEPVQFSDTDYDGGEQIGGGDGGHD